MNLDGVVIESMAVALPRNSTSARDLVGGCRAPIDFEMQAITGIASTPTAEAGEYSVDLAETAIRRCLARSRYLARDIDLLISGTLLNSNAPGNISLEPGMASAIKARLGFDRALTVDVSCACAGLFAALRVADAFLESNAATRVLVFSGEFVTQAARAAQAQIESANDPRMPCLTVGDSALAMVIERTNSEGAGFSNLQLFTLGRYSGHCVAKPTDQAPGGVVMETDAVRLALVTSKEGLLHFQRSYSPRAGEPAQFDFLVPHQASASSLAGAMRDANKRNTAPLLTNDNVINNLERRGNTVTTTHFLAIYDAILQGRIRNGHRLLLSTVASGVTIGSVGYRMDALAERIVEQTHAGEADRNAAKSSTPLCGGLSGDWRATWRQPLRQRVEIQALGVAEQSNSGATTLSLAKAAARACLEQADCDRNDVDVVLFAGVARTGFVIEPAIAAFLTGELRMNDTSSSERRTLAFDLSDSSNGFLSACNVAARILDAGSAQHVLVVVAEAEVPRAPGSPGVFPSASAALLRRSPKERGFHSFCCTEYAQFAALNSSVVAVRALGGAEWVRSVATEYSDALRECVTDALMRYFEAETNVRQTVDDIVLPKMSDAALRDLRLTLGIREDCRLTVTEREQPWFTSAVPRAWLELAGRMSRAHGRALFVSVGAGLKVVCASYEW